jgi:DNA-directed RNA polymerase subunit RPC12/RpoP
MKTKGKVYRCSDCGIGFYEKNGIVRKSGRNQCGRCLVGTENPGMINPYVRTESVFDIVSPAPRREHRGVS